jgi:hypothetical protein
MKVRMESFPEALITPSPSFLVSDMGREYRKG